MPSQYQMLSIPFTSGVDTKSSDIAIAPPKLADLQNSGFNANGLLAKRLGTSAYPNAVLRGPSNVLAGVDKIESGDALANFQGQLLLFSKGTAYVAAESAKGWSALQSLIPCQTSVTQLTRTQGTKTQPSIAAHPQGISAAAYVASDGSVRMTVWDQLAATTYQQDVTLAANATRPVCVVDPTRPFIYVYYAVTSVTDSALTYVRRIDVGNPAALPDETIFTAVANLGLAGSHPPPGEQPVFDVIYDGSKLVGISRLPLASPAQYLIGPISPRGGYSAIDAGEAFDTFVLNMATYPGAAAIDCALQAQMLADGRMALTGVSATGAPCVMVLKPTAAGGYVFEASATSTLAIAGYGSACNVSAASLSADGFPMGAPLPSDRLGVVSAIEYGGVAASVGTSNRGVFLCLWELQPAPAEVPNSGTLTARTPTLAMRRAALLSQALLDQGGNPQWLLTYVSDTQQTLFVLASDGSVQGKLIPTLAGGPTEQPGTLARPAQSGSTLYLPIQQATRLLSDSGTLQSEFGLALVAFDYDPTGRFQNAQLGDSLYICGAQLWHYDGQSLTEDGFHVFPDPPAATPSGTGGSIGSGTRNYRAVFAWQDRNGNVHRSAPSLPISVTTSGSTSKVQLQLSTLQVTNKARVQLELYRTRDADSNSYLVTSPSAPLINDPAQDFIAFTDTLSDATLASNQLLYTVGGVLDADGPPAMKTVYAGTNRVYGLPADDPTKVWYTQEYVPGSGTAWSQALTRRVNMVNGAPLTLATMDDKVIVFNATRAIYSGGEGPTPNGLDDRFTPFVEISSDTGCANQDSLVNTQDGLMMQTAKGIRLLGRDLSWVDVGADVTLYNGEIVTSANQMPDVNQIRFTTKEGRMLTYDTYWRRPNAVGANVGQWSTATNYASQDATVWRGQFVSLQDNGRVRLETPGSYRDDTRYVSQVVTTAWIKPAGEQGQARIRRLMLLGNYLSPHVLTIRIAYDFGPFVEVLRYVPRETLAKRVWGGDEDPNPAYDPGEVWGGEEVWGGDLGEDGVYRIRIHPQRRRCQAIRLEISDSPDPASTEDGAGYSLNVLSMETAVQGRLSKPGSNKQAR